MDLATACFSTALPVAAMPVAAMSGAAMSGAAQAAPGPVFPVSHDMLDRESGDCDRGRSATGAVPANLSPLAGALGKPIDGAIAAASVTAGNAPWASRLSPDEVTVSVDFCTPIALTSVTIGHDEVAGSDVNAPLGVSVGPRGGASPAWPAWPVNGALGGAPAPSALTFAAVPTSRQPAAAGRRARAPSRSPGGCAVPPERDAAHPLAPGRRARDHEAPSPAPPRPRRPQAHGDPEPMTDTAEADLIAMLRTYVEAESPTADPAAVNRVMDLAEGDLRAMGCTVSRIPGRDGFGDHIAAQAPWSGDGNGAGVLVLCHLDTVHPIGAFGPAPFRVEDGKAVGPGTADMKGGVVIALAALRDIIEAGRETPLALRFLITSDEEVGSPTSRALIEEEGERAKYALVVEPARNGGRIVTSRRGVGRYRMEAHGRASHAGVAHGDGRSAIAEIARQVLAVEAMTDHARGLTFNIGRIGGGTTDNTVPEHAWASVDVRADDAALAQGADAALKALRAHDPDVTLTVTGAINRPPYPKTPGIEALLDEARALAAEIGFELRDMHTGGGSDGSFIAARVPTLDGMGVDGAGAHTLWEHALVASFVPRMMLLRRLMETLR